MESKDCWIAGMFFAKIRTLNNVGKLIPVTDPSYPTIFDEEIHNKINQIKLKEAKLKLNEENNNIKNQYETMQCNALAINLKISPKLGKVKFKQMKNVKIAHSRRDR